MLDAAKIMQTKTNICKYTHTHIYTHSTLLTNTHLLTQRNPTICVHEPQQFEKSCIAKLLTSLTLAWLARCIHRLAIAIIQGILSVFELQLGL